MSKCDLPAAGGLRRVLKVLQQQAPAEVTVEASGCLGQCGNGPVILVQPENIWHLRVSPQVAKRIATEQLGDDDLFKRSQPSNHNHSSQKFIWMGAVAVGLFLLLCIGAALTLGAKYRYL